RSSASGSDGCQVRSESALAKCTTCCPVPLAISNTRPRRGRTRASTSSIGPLLRSAEGVDHFPLAVFSPRCLSITLVREGLTTERAVAGPPQPLVGPHAQTTRSSLPDTALLRRSVHGSPCCRPLSRVG